MTASKWADWPLLCFDVETSGISMTEDRIVTAALVVIEPGQRPDTTLWAVDPGIDINPDATAVHGITREAAAAQATHTPEQMLAELTGRLALWMGRGKPVAVFNGAFDFTLLEVENRRNHVDTLADRLGPGKVSPIVDVHVIDKYAHPFRKGGRKLTQVCETYGVIHTGAHDAGADALAAGRLFPKIMAKHARKFPGMTIGSLHQAQIGWRKDQADSLRAYFDKQGTPHDGVDPGWPFYLSVRDVLAGAA